MDKRSLKPTPRLSLLIVALVVLAGACSEAEQPELTQPLTITHAEHTFAKEDCESEADSCLVISIAYPEFSGGGLLADSLNSLVQDFVLSGQQGEQFDNFEGLKAHYDTMYAGLLQDMSLPVQPWTITTTAELIWQNDPFFSFEMHDSRYTGGAHGSYTTLLTTFDADGMYSMDSPDALFQEGGYGTALKIFEEEFRKENNIAPDESFSEAGFWFEEDEFVLNTNFALTEEGIRVFYNHYEIAPYAAGTFEVTVPYEDLRLILSRELTSQLD